MISSKHRMAVLVAVGSLLTGCGGNAGPATGAPSASGASTAPAVSLAGLEGRFHARLGVAAVDTGTGRTVTYRADERFAHCSTFKLLAAGILLKRETDAQLDHVVHYRAADLEDYSPITAKHVRTGMKLRELIAAALQYSDNTAANILLDRLGGPHGLQTALRGIGDTTDRIDRTEPTLNDATPGDLRDTSTPRSLETDMRRFALGDVLPADRRLLLTNWLKGNTTGGPYIRAGVPTGWTVGDKTGSGGYGTRNDVAVIWPAGGGAPIVIAVLSDRKTKDAKSDDALIADATKATLAALR